LPKKGLLAHRKLTNKDENIIAEITDNLKETIYDAKQEELNSMLDDGKAKTPAKTTSRRKSTETEAKSAEKSAEKPVKKKRKTANLTPVGKLGQQISGLKLQIYALKAKKVKAKAQENTETYDAEAKVYVKQLKDYGKTKEGKAISAEINEVLDNVDEIANLRDAEWRDRSIIVIKIKM